ncbi:MAG TPA: DUF998 domain-containing protein [Acidimicrobiales bacterium]|nr:DUF998 domain-containing protein [Acidimicrobiales bacterium]
MKPSRALALGGVVGPAAFITAWSALGWRKAGYTPIEDHISRLAAQGVAERPAMTAGFVAFGVGVPLYALALRRSPTGHAWIAAATTGVATLGVAAFPLDGPAGDGAHAIAAGVGYATLAAIPLLAARPLARAGLTMWSRFSWAAGGAAALCLAATTAGPATGLAQRAGLTIGDVWLIGSALALFTGRLGRPLPRPGESG